MWKVESGSLKTTLHVPLSTLDIIDTKISIPKQAIFIEFLLLFKKILC
jgi:hypothetical protein